MPLYDYQCDSCGHRFEVRQGIKEDPLTECPQCGSPIRRVIHPVGIVFKGSGFYITDSRHKSSATTSSNSDGASGDKSDKKEPSSSDSAASKPAAESTATASANTSPASSSSPSSSSGSTT